MHLLVTAPTWFEIQPLTNWLKQVGQSKGNQNYRFQGHDIVIKITGVGAVLTTFTLTRILHEMKPNLVIQAGVAGSYVRGFTPGRVVAVARDYLADWGAEDHDDFLDVFQLGLVQPQAFPFQAGWLVNPHVERLAINRLSIVSAITVQTTSGSESTIAFRRTRFHADIETMEGAAFHYVCLMLQLPFLQIRSISNFVEPRDKSRWHMQEAIQRLNETLQEWIQLYLPRTKEELYL
ncbi:MAG: futalosine hydrolase [Thermoflavifilum sp.]|nr:futalosine hydrolase [Thermoflavifilum sp.]